jgi:DNA-binding transcriptional LysR family regulator
MALIEHLEKLRHFHKISQFKSINEASQKTGYSQAGLSKSLILLEAELGCKLFNRTRTGLSLTKEGEEALFATKNIIGEASALEIKLRFLSKSKSPKRIRIGMYDSIAIYFGLSLNDYLSRIYPDVTVELDADSSLNLFNKMQSGALDIAIGVNFKLTDNRGMVISPLFKDSYSFYASPKVITNERTNTFIVHSSATDQNGLKLREIFKSELKGKQIHSVNNFETLKHLVIGGLGVGILPSLVARPLVDSRQIDSFPIRNSKLLNGIHSIDVLVRGEIQNSYKEFVKDILRLGDRWAKT